MRKYKKERKRIIKEMNVFSGTNKQVIRWKASFTIESAFVLPICIMIIFFIIQIGILIYDGYVMSMVAQEWVQRTAEKGGDEWKTELQSVLNRRMLYPKEVKWQETGENIILQMEYHTFWTIRVNIMKPRENKAMLYHYLNGQQLVDRIPPLQEMRDKYFKILKKIKVDKEEDDEKEKK